MDHDQRVGAPAPGGAAGPGRSRQRLTAYQRRAQAITRLHHRRHLVQLAVAAFVVALAVRHQSEQSPGAASVDAVCPFGAVETLWTWITTGAFISKIHASNLVMGLALLLATLLAGNAFCGWVCPFGAVQDALTWARRRLHLPTVTVPPRLDRWLRRLRYAVLALVLVMSATTVRLWFAEVDPYVNLFGLSWLYEPDLAARWPGLLVLGLVLVASLLIERAWCRYLCPLGGVLSVLGHVSIVRVRRSATACTGCNLCVKPCPVGIDVAKPVAAVSPDCIGCLECVANCPTGGALEVSAAAPWTSWRKALDPAALAHAGRTPTPVTIGRRPPKASAAERTSAVEHTDGAER